MVYEDASKVWLQNTDNVSLKFTNTNVHYQRNFQGQIVADKADSVMFRCTMTK